MFWLVLRLIDGQVINADLTSLLPAADRDPFVEAATARVRDRFERRLVLLVGAADFAAARAAAAVVHDRLRDSGQLQSLKFLHDRQALRDAGNFYFPFRFQLLSREAAGQLRAGDAAAFERRILSHYYSPASALTSGLIERDPLLLLPDFLGERASRAGGRARLEDGVLTVRHEGRVYLLLSGELADTPFSFTLQDRLMPLLDRLRSEVAKRSAGTELILAGVLPHAAAGRATAEREISTVGLISLVGVVLLLILVFRSGWPFGLTLLSIAVGCLAGFAACLALFGQVHLLTLVFGASLVGISVDYSFHYFCERFRLRDAWTPAAALRHVFPGITLGLITSVIGFSGLLLAPFPGMRQMAVFSSAGLIAAYGCVVIWYPAVTRAPGRTDGGRALRWAAAYGRLWGDRLRAGQVILLGGLAVLAAVGCFRLIAEDDVRLLQAPDPRVVAAAQRLQTIVGQDLASQFFLIEGRDTAELLAREERLTLALRRLGDKELLGGYLAISDFVPSPARQAENRALLRPVISGEDGLVARLARQVGLTDATVEATIRDFDRSKAPLDMSDWLAHRVSEPYRHLWLGAAGQGVAAVVGLTGVRDLDALRSLHAPDRGVRFIDTVGDLSALFAKYRQQTAWLTLASYVVVTLLTIVRFGWLGGAMVMSVPVMAAFVSLGTLGMLGEPVSLFNVMALLLVLGIGVDYGLFLREAGKESATTLLAIALSALTTVLAFGLLAFSDTAAIHAFGLTICVGIGVAVLLSPLAGIEN